MIKKSVLVVLLLAKVSLTAQDYKFGKVSAEEIKENYYPSDSTADAAYLFHSRKTHYRYSNNVGFELINEYKIRMKLYSKEGFDFATIKIPYVRPESGSSEKINGLKAYTYNLDEKGKVVKTKLSGKDEFDEKVSRFRHVKTITMPNLKEGSVVEIKYTLTSPYTDYIDDLEFQFGIPVKRLTCKIETPEWLVFAKKNKGYFLIEPQESKYNSKINFRNKVRTTTTYGGRGKETNTSYQNSSQELAYNVSFYEGENIPALKANEPFIGSIRSYRGGVKYELVGTRYPNAIPKNFSKSWDNVTKQIYKSSSFGNELTKKNYFEKNLDPLLEGVSSNQQKMAIIFDFVKANVKWNGYYNKYTDKGVKKAFKEKEGNSADINLMLTAMLRHAGLEANPVLISSKGNGIPLFPTLKGFDYVISMVQFPDNTYALLDATEVYSKPNVLPVRALNFDGRLVKQDGTSSWVKLTTSVHALEENMVIAKINQELLVVGMVRTKLNNLNALNYRKRNNHVKEDELISKYEEANNIEIEDFKVTNKENSFKPIVRTVKFSSEDLVEGINGKLYIEPLLFLAQNTNPFKLKERKFPVDFATSWKDVNRVSIEIPTGYAIETLPKPLAVALPDNIGVFKYQVSQAGNKIKVFSVLQFNASMVAPQYYDFLKDFYSKLVKKETEKIVLVKS